MDLYSKDPNLSRYLVNPTEENKLAAEASLKEFTREVADTQVFYNYSLVNFNANIILDSIGGKLLHINYGKDSSDWIRFRDTGFDFAGRDLIQPSSLILLMLYVLYGKVLKMKMERLWEF